VPQSPALSQQRWEGLLDGGIREMQRLVARYAKDGANFLDAVPKKLLPDLYYLGDFKDVAVYAFFASSRWFVVNAPGPGLAKFLGARLGRLGRRPAAPSVVLLTSGDPEETAGLAELVGKSHAQVAVPDAAAGELRKACPAGTTFLSPEELARKGWFSVQAIPLRGRGVGPVAYLVTWSGKSVLFTGRIPIKPASAAVRGLVTDFRNGRGNVAGYLHSLRRLGGVNPDLWLPTFPVNGQNASLYESEWQEVLAENRALFRGRP
jgi:hypothetical protein